MARRKKEAEGFHQEQIARSAQELFGRQGIDTTTMDQLAKFAGYSKATLYVYFKSKEELIDYLVYQSMLLLHEHIDTAITCGRSVREAYDAICWHLVEYQEQHPYYFDIVLKTIDVQHLDQASMRYQTFHIGEAINRSIAVLLEKGKAQQELHYKADTLTCVFYLWASISGVIQLASNKQDYLMTIHHKEKEAFLTSSFAMLYQSLL